MSNTARMARLLDSSWAAQEADMLNKLGIHKAQIERTQERLDRIAQSFGRFG